MYKAPGEGWKSGLEYLKPCLNSHKPVDAVVMMLGTNDLKMDFGLCTEEIAAGAERLVQEIHDFAAEKQKFCPENHIDVTAGDWGKYQQAGIRRSF